MMNATVVNDKYTSKARIWIHLSGETIKILYKLISIVPADFDMAVNYAINSDCR
jgi:hypothetical protein